MDESEAFEPDARPSDVPTARELGYSDGELVTVDRRDVVELRDEDCHVSNDAWLATNVGNFVRDVDLFR